tara:strand:+ start:318 stop:482 length:165 start_codon:yes stop_codon:yes gene_type:complete
MRNKKAIRASRHESQPITSNTSVNPQENIAISSKGLVKEINFNGKIYQINMSEK